MVGLKVESPEISFYPFTTWLGQLLMVKNANVIYQDIGIGSICVLGWLYVTLFVAEILWQRKITNIYLHQSRKLAFVQIYFMGIFVFIMLEGTIHCFSNILCWNFPQHQSVLFLYLSKSSSRETFDLIFYFFLLGSISEKKY